MDRVLSIVMAGGLGERLRPLTQERAKASVPFGGKYRLIDFTLSNCINSGLRRILVLTQYKSGSLLKHIQDGWGISNSGLGEYVYPIPAQQKLGADWYRGTADAVRQNLDLLRDDIDQVMVLSGDHIYKMNYAQMISYHRRTKAAATISAVRATKEQAARKLGVIEVNDDYRMVSFEEKPADPKTMPGAPEFALSSMGVYVFDAQVMKEALQQPGDDFGKDVIPAMMARGCDIFVYDYDKNNSIQDYVDVIRGGVRERVLVDCTRDSAYWRDVGTIDSYYEAGMDLIGIDPLFNMYGRKWPVRTLQKHLPPSKCVLGGTVSESAISDGCIISGGAVWRSILSPGVVVERGSRVEESIVLDDAVIEPGARVRRAIIDKEARIKAGASLGFDTEADRRRGCTMSDAGIVVVPKGMEIEP